VDAARNADLIAGVSFDDVSYISTVYFWQAADSVPFYTFNVPFISEPAGETPILTSSGGAIVVLAVNMLDNKTNTNFARIYWFTDVQGTVQVNNYDCPNNSFVRALQLSSDGTTVSAVITSSVLVISTISGEAIWEFDFDFSTSTLCMSTDGSYISYGFTTSFIMERNATGYSVIYDWSKTPALIASACAISGTGMVGMSWANFAYNQLTVDALQITKSSVSTLWTYSSKVDPGQYQNNPVWAEITEDGTVLAVGSWGDTVSPTITVFDTSNSTGPIYTMVTPGSMFDIDVIRIEDTAYVAAGGKHVHANDFGDGGDLYAIEITLN